MSKQLKLPISLVLLNGIGGILIGLGLADLFGDIKLIPQAFRVDNYQYIMILVGVLMELPFIIFLVRHATGKGPREV